MANRIKALNQQQIEICQKAGIDPKGYGVEFADDEKMVLRHFKTGYEVWIRREGLRSW